MSKPTRNSNLKQRSQSRPFKNKGPASSSRKRPQKTQNSTKRTSAKAGRKTNIGGSMLVNSKARDSTPGSKTTNRSNTNSALKNSKAGYKRNQLVDQSTQNIKPEANSASASDVSNSYYEKPFFIIVDEEHAGQRVDNFLVTRLKGVPKTHIYRIIRKGEVRVNKGRVKQVTRLQEGDSVRIPPIRLANQTNQELDGSRYEFLRKTVLFEDDALLVINKPSGMAVHAGSGIKVGVIEAMRALRHDLKYLELVHRLDRETSGCLVLAKKSSALKILHEDFKTNSLKNKRLDKRYTALVKGYWKHGQRRITKALNTDARKHGERHVVVDEAGSYASSIVTPLGVSEQASLLEVKLLTGRTHQVRVHVLSEGHPIAGDQRYGDKDFNKQAKKHKLSRLFLHASSLRFNHPLLGNTVTVTADLPPELQTVANSFDLCIN